MNRPKRKKRQPSGIRDGDGPLRCPGHLQWVRGHECSVDADHLAVIEAHHMKTRGAGGGDDTAVPLCAFCHEEWHRIGRDTFAEKYSIDLDKIASDIAAQSPHLRKLRMKEKQDG